MSNVPASTCGRLPRTGASTMATAAASRDRISVTESGPIVDISSSNEPSGIAAATSCAPNSTSDTAVPSVSIVTITSAPVTAERPESAICAPGTGSPGVRFHAVTSKPASTSRPAISAPMRPSPRKAIMSATLCRAVQSDQRLIPLAGMRCRQRSRRRTSALVVPRSRSESLGTRDHGDLSTSFASQVSVIKEPRGVAPLRRYDHGMQDLAPDIGRQRLLIEGYFTIDVDEGAIERYFDALTTALELRTYAAPTIFAPGGLGRDENEGYDAFIPLIDSGISLYVWSRPRFLSAVLFTCKRFDANRAVAVTRDFFAMREVASQDF